MSENKLTIKDTTIPDVWKQAFAKFPPGGPMTEEELTSTWSCPSCRDKDAEIERLRQRVAELEQQIALAKAFVHPDDAFDDWDDWTEDMAGAMV